MARWLEGIQEAAFKPAAGGGHVFQSPHPWLFGRPRYYQVDDAQKAMIGEFLRKRTLVALMFIPIALVTIAVFFGLLAYGMLPRLSPIVAGLGFAAVLLLPMVVAPHVYFMWTFASIRKDLQLSDQKFTMRQQFSGIASAMPNWVLYGGLAGGVLMILGAMMGMYDLASAGRPAGRWISPIISMTGGMMFVGYFAYLASLKRKLAKTS